MKYGLWTVLKKTSHKNSNRTYLWLCRCECGKEKLLQIHSLYIGKSKGCGCYLTDDAARFEKFKNKFKINENGCWIWTESINQDGYGRIGDILAHRYSFEKFKGNIPKDLCVCHNCPGGDNRSCVNPDHLWLGTQQENMKDKIPKNRQLRGEKIKNSKITKKDVLEIRKRCSKGENTLIISKEYNISRSLVYHIKNYRAWKHIP